CHSLRRRYDADRRLRLDICIGARVRPKVFSTPCRFSRPSFDILVEERRSNQMRFMMIVKADKNSEAGVMPDEKLLSAMMKYNEELSKAGILLAGEGLHPSSKGARVRFSD